MKRQLKNQLDVVQLREKFAFPITRRFATQHSFATHSVQLRYEGLLLMMVTFHDDCYMRNCEKQPCC